MEYNNFNKPSKRLLETSKRIERQTEEYLNKYYTNLREEQNSVENERYEKSMSAARFSAASSYARSKQRKMAMSEAINYTNKTSIIGMTEVMSRIVEESLLFDTVEYSKTNPHYREEIRESIRDILENGNILQDIKNRDTLLIMEHVAKNIPDLKTGVNLTEDEISAFMSKEPAIEVEAAIKRLSENVKGRVANLVEKEQARVKKVKNEMPKGKEEELSNLDTVPTDEIMDQDQDGQVDQLENPEENLPPEEEGYEEMPAEGDVPPEEMPQEGMEEDPSMMSGGAAPTKQISITPDGTVNVNIFESMLDEELACIIEDGFLTEKFNDTKYIARSANKAYTKPSTRFGNIAGFVFSGITGALIGRFLGKMSATSEHREEIDMLEKLVRNDSEAMSIIDEIKDAYSVKDSGRARSLKKDFAIRVKELKDEIKRKGTDSFKESVDSFVNGAISKTRLFYRDVPRSGLIESLAVNAAQNMIAESGVYNRDIAFANALTYVTIIEAFAETGLLNVDKVAYDTITQQAGGKTV